MAGERRRGSAVLCRGVLRLSLLAGAAAAQAIPVVSIEGGTGVPGGSVAALARAGRRPRGDGGERRSDRPLPRPAARRRPRQLRDRRSALSDTHALTAERAESRQSCTCRSSPPTGRRPLDDGPLATCDVTIAARYAGRNGGARPDRRAARRRATSRAGRRGRRDDRHREPASRRRPSTITATPTVTPTITLTPCRHLTPTPTSTPTADAVPTDRAVRPVRQQLRGRRRPAPSTRGRCSGCSPCSGDRSSRR